MSVKKELTFRKRWSSFACAFRGIILFLREQPNARIHFVAAVGAVMAGIFLSISLAEWIVVTIVIGFVLSAELFNSSIEELVNIISPEYQKRAGNIKDLAAGAVLVAAITALTVGLIIFLPRLSVCLVD